MKTCCEIRTETIGDRVNILMYPECAHPMLTRIAEALSYRICPHVRYKNTHTHPHPCVKCAGLALHAIELTRETQATHNTYLALKYIDMQAELALTHAKDTASYNAFRKLAPRPGEGAIFYIHTAPLRDRYGHVINDLKTFREYTGLDGTRLHRWQTRKRVDKQLREYETSQTFRRIWAP